MSIQIKRYDSTMLVTINNIIYDYSFCYKCGNYLYSNTNQDVKKIAGAELVQLGKNILSGLNPLSTVFVPTAGTINQGIAKATTSTASGLGINVGDIDS